MWDTDELYEAKYERLTEFAKGIELGVDDDLIVIAISAGGSLAVRYLYENPHIQEAILIAGKLKGWRSIGTSYQKRAPALLESVKQSENLLGEPNAIAADVLVVRGLWDGVVPIKDMYIEGADTKILPTIGHTTSIAFALLYYLPRLLRA
jgi:pimeloyl-ACP methyl ester carboxylesterase